MMVMAKMVFGRYAKWTRQVLGGNSRWSHSGSSDFHDRPKLVTSTKRSQLSLSFDPKSIRLDDATVAGYEARLAAASDSQIRWRLRQPAGEAAVLLPLCTVHGQASVLLTVRSAELRSHTSQVAFPGGNRDPTDDSLCTTALRETAEEIGIDSTRIRVLGHRPSVPNRTMTKTVTPFVGNITDSHLDIPSVRRASNPAEVADVFTVPISDLLDPNRCELEDFRGLGVTIPSWVVGKHRIWGLTAYVLDAFLREIVIPCHSKTK